VEALADGGLIPGGTRRNLSWVADRLDAPGVAQRDLLVLADAQTSGGLLFGVAPDGAAAVVEQLRGADHDVAVVGRVTGRGDGHISVIGGRG
jgi:selenide,water dikinase